MNNTDRPKNIDQANELKQLFNEVNQNQSNHLQDLKSKLPKIDVLNLPPRKDVHKSSNKGMHIPISKPFLRFFFVVVLLICLIVILFSIGEFDFFDLFK